MYFSSRSASGVVKQKITANLLFSFSAVGSYLDSWGLKEKGVQHPNRRGTNLQKKLQPFPYIDYWVSSDEEILQRISFLLDRRNWFKKP